MSFRTPENYASVCLCWDDYPKLEYVCHMDLDEVLIDHTKSNGDKCVTVKASNNKKKAY
ncbi:hypothetical protein RO3G_00959 [Rhizopus delemar RA 99-880]|uniref:Uncharacterized protein n=1 Tax=Rhizopus delemar (strain RA 99-880 / ATCC MYA-4621 / FGSC 9543 / NRRL 43880) TaxID=246409 RepID=I1BJ75_RHIO9|nr:hypothetical protein RO3G_00959 [Rhizopus delemar RA 99-880]|eukprot:EIE76255.1 hypothetical protein RO3G_00959 [Rhizopus delemar RA 99-880]